MRAGHAGHWALLLALGAGMPLCATAADQAASSPANDAAATAGTDGKAVTLLPAVNVQGSREDSMPLHLRDKVESGALGGSILPYFSLVILVGMIIPACRLLERKWERFDRSGADEWRLRTAFRRDRVLVWLAAIGLPFVISGVFKAVTPLI